MSSLFVASTGRIPVPPKIHANLQPQFCGLCVFAVGSLAQDGTTLARRQCHPEYKLTNDLGFVSFVLLWQFEPLVARHLHIP